MDDDLDALRALVHADPELQARLRRRVSFEGFTELVLELAGEHGIAMTAERLRQLHDERQRIVHAQVV